MLTIPLSRSGVVDHDACPLLMLPPYADAGTIALSPHRIHVPHGLCLFCPFLSGTRGWKKSLLEGATQGSTQRPRQTGSTAKNIETLTYPEVPVTDTGVQ